MGLETGWSGITEPGIENRFMDSVSQLQYPDAYRDAKRKEKKERKKKKKKKKKKDMRMHRAVRVLRPALLRMLNRPRDYACGF